MNLAENGLNCSQAILAAFGDQFGVETFGLAGPDIDAELILMSNRLWHLLGMSGDVTLELNSLGSSEARQKYREVLVEYFEAHKSSLDEDSQRRLKSNPLRILDSKNPVIDIMPDQKKKLAEGNYGGSMRLGSYPAIIKKGTVASFAYKSHIIKERHRHRFEVNPEYVEMIEKAGLVFSGTSPDGKLMEIAELPKSKHPFFVSSQFHPEFLARPLSPHPLFTEFIKASLGKKK